MSAPIDNFVVLYKDGAESPPLHPIDAAAWLNLGWSKEVEPVAQETADSIEEVEPTEEVKPQTAASRKKT